MNKIWANRLVAGNLTWDDVPAARQNGVKADLAGRVEANTITAEQYAAIVGEPYEV